MLTLARNLAHQIKARPIPADLFEVIIRTSQGQAVRRHLRYLQVTSPEFLTRI